MKCDLSKEQLIGYLYQDMEPGEQAAIEAHLAQCPACQRELEELSSTTETLRAWPDEEPNMNLVFVQEKMSRWKARMPSWLRRWSGRRLTVSVAVGIATVLVVLALVNLEATYGHGNFSVKLSLLPRPSVDSESPQDPLAAPVTRGELAAWQQESLPLILEMIQIAEERQRRERNLALAQFARDMDLQRRQDLRLVGEGLEVVELSTQNRFRRTDEVLHQLLTVAQFQMEQPRSLQRE